MKRRSSLNISLVLMGTLALAACQKEKRNVYNSKEDCMQDWGNDQNCEEITDNNNHYGGNYYTRGFYYGPRYSGSDHAAAGMHSSRSIAVARGGFGGFAGFHGGGGHS